MLSNKINALRKEIIAFIDAQVATQGIFLSPHTRALDFRPFDIVHKKDVKINYINSHYVYLSNGDIVDLFDVISLTNDFILNLIEKEIVTHQYDEDIIRCGDVCFDQNHADTAEQRRHHLICKNCLTQNPQLLSLIVSDHGNHDECSVTGCKNTHETKCIRLDKDAQLTFTLHPTNGCVEVQAKTKDEAFDKIKNALNKHIDIECDWIDGHVIPTES